MAYLVINPSGTEFLFCRKPSRQEKNINGKVVKTWYPWADEHDAAPNPCITLPTGSIEELTGQKMTWDNEPIRI